MIRYGVCFLHCHTVVRDIELIQNTGELDQTCTLNLGPLQNKVSK